MTTQNLNLGRTVVEILGQHKVSGAEVDSSARYPPPRCHPGTRKALRARITAWLNEPCGSNILWLYGPAGVGKSAVAQTVAEHSRGTGCLGAAFFFSRPNKRNNPNGVLPTLAYQLAIQYPDYKHIIAQYLVDDPSILDKDLRTQFRELIITPFAILESQISPITQRPLLIILDGLDECDGEDAQCDFVHLIGEYARTTGGTPLLWMICSRPEPYLKNVFSRTKNEIRHKREEITPDDHEARNDIITFLRDGFEEIRERYSDVICVPPDESWPPRVHLQAIARASSGLFIFASTLLKFIGGSEGDDPETQLNVCITFLDKSREMSINPLHPLDLLYLQILLTIPTNTLPTTMRIMSMCLFYRQHHQLSAQELCYFLHLDQSTFYSSLRRLHSVMDVPPAPYANKHSLQFYHASFGDFLRDERRSGSFYAREDKTHSDVAIHCLRWLKDVIKSECGLAG
ncbi:hypothetical protein P691DRAFT_739176 [Macrolepiota fuliginosa MF-IS2]|uniref:Nephrocystin 3-like N-terminal domain-containing protein n=1 Tax=Macrolepiota fuliginosa MF-IS2 TaxID=1400762 RepID=A0A9P5X2R1_9AGAR|nr:hypothetical protein P691DRAFT_739176 [Macrolepiota fuliginosa MF-IS2]